MNGDYIRKNLKLLRISVSEAARILGIPNQNLHQKLRSNSITISFLEKLSEKINPCFFTNLPLFQKYRHLKSNTRNNVMGINNNVLKINSENNNNTNPETNEKEKEQHKLEIKHLKEEIELQKEIIALQKKMLKNQ